MPSTRRTTVTETGTEKWKRHRIRNLQPPQMVESRVRVVDGMVHEDVIMYSIPLELQELGVEKQYPYFPNK
jgi:hypothetical protein